MNSVLQKIMNKISKKILIGIFVVVAGVGSYFYYDSIRNPVTIILDEISEETIGVDLDPIFDQLQKIKDSSAKQIITT